MGTGGGGGATLFKGLDYLEKLYLKVFVNWTLQAAVALCEGL